MKHFLLYYDFFADCLERRAALRPAHVAHARLAAGAERPIHAAFGRERP